MTKLVSAFRNYARALYVLLPAILAHGTGIRIGTAVCMLVIKTLGSVALYIIASISTRRRGPKGA